MKHLQRHWRFIAGALLAAVLCTQVVPQAALAGTTGAISGTVKSASGVPLADVKVTASGYSQTATSTTNAHGFYTILGLSPDTYTVSFQKAGYQPISVPGVAAFQDETQTVNATLETELKTIATVRASGGSSLVKANVTQDEYTVSGSELNAISGGNDLHKTLYQYIQAVPGVTATGFAGQPRIHGGSVTDTQYEFDGIPIRERMTGFFTTNLSNVGIGNVEVYTGGLNASQAASGLGIINTVVKSGTYPGFATVSYGTAADKSRLNDLTVEYGGATPNRRFSWYFALDKTDALNEYASGQTYPAVLVEGYNGPGLVKTTDIIANFHYRPSTKDDFQFLMQNGIGDFIYDYGLQRAPGEPVPLTTLPCPGYVVNTKSPSGASGGNAPNGQPCPIGLYFSTADTQNGGGNIWHHYSGIGKIQWDHILDDHSLLTMRLSENFNQYIFDQPMVDPNVPALENSPDFRVSANCPLYPYYPGTPVQSSGPNGTGAECQAQQNWFSTGYYGDRRSNMWLGSLDYTNTLSQNTLLKAGISQEYDNNLWNTYFSWYFNADGSWPGINSLSSYPDHVQAGYVDVSQRFGKFLVDPGVLYQRMEYDYPGGPYGVGIWNPTFSLTYTMGLKDVIRGSYTDSTSFVGTGYVYRVGSSYYNPGSSTFSASPTIVHSYDLQWEHQFDPNTSLRIGPYFNKASNIFRVYRPLLSISASGIPTYGPTQASNGGFRQAMGAELGFSHVDPRPVGISYWLAATYDNFWTNSTASLVGSYGASYSANQPSFLPVIRSSQDPLFSATLSADIHKDRFHLYPLVYYEGPSFYQVGDCETTTKWQNTPGVGTPFYPCGAVSSALVKPLVMVPELKSNGYWMANLTGLVNLGEKRDLTLGMSIQNLFGNENDVAPCYVTQQVNTPALLPGCAPYYPSAQTPGQAMKPGTYTYQNYSQQPTQIQLFVTKKFGP
jgi:hypothetical protein